MNKKLFLLAAVVLGTLTQESKPNALRNVKYNIMLTLRGLTGCESLTTPKQRLVIKNAMDNMNHCLREAVRYPGAQYYYINSYNTLMRELYMQQLPNNSSAKTCEERFQQLRNILNNY